MVKYLWLSRFTYWDRVLLSFTLCNVPARDIPGIMPNIHTSPMRIDIVFNSKYFNISVFNIYGRINIIINENLYTKINLIITRLILTWYTKTKVRVKTPKTPFADGPAWLLRKQKLLWILSLVVNSHRLVEAINLRCSPWPFSKTFVFPLVLCRL